MKRENKEFLYMKLAGVLRKNIQSGMVKPGEFLMSENELAKYYEVSRVSVRKSLELLEQDGLVERKVGKGTVVLKGNERSTADKTTLNLIATYPAYFMDVCMPGIIKAFEQENPHLKINVINFPTFNFSDAIESARKLGVNPHILFATDAQYNELKLAEPLLNLRGITVDDQRGIYPKLLNSFTHDGSLKAFPVTFSPVYLAYNPLLFDSFSVSQPEPGWTYDDMVVAAKQLTSDTNHDGIIDQYGISLSPIYTRWPVIALQNHVNFKRVADNPQSLKHALRILHQLLYIDKIALYHVPFPHGEHYDPFVKGKTGMLLTTAMEMAGCQNRSLDFDPKIAPLSFGVKKATVLVSNILMIPEACDQKEAANSFVRFLARADIQEKFARTTPFLSVISRLNEKVKGSTLLKAINLSDESLANCYFTAELFPDPNVLEEMAMEMDLFWKGLESVDSLMKRLPQILQLGWRSEGKP